MPRIVLCGMAKYGRPFACLVLAVLALARAAAAASWTDEYDALIREQPNNARAVVEVLEKLPLAQRATADYHGLLARACQAADLPGPAAEAAATCAILAPRGEHDLAAVRAWLAQRGAAFARGAADARLAQDTKSAVRAFLVAAKCAPALLADDAEVTEEALHLLDRAAAAHPEKTAYAFQVGFLAYLAGQLDKALVAFTACARSERDPYRKWRAQAWCEHVAMELNPPKAGERDDTPSMRGLERGTPGMLH